MNRLVDQVFVHSAAVAVGSASSANAVLQVLYQHSNDATLFCKIAVLEFCIKSWAYKAMNKLTASEIDLPRGIQENWTTTRH